MKQIVLLLIALFVPAGILQAEPDTYWANNAATQFAGGDGESAETAYIISTAAELAFFANEFNAGKGDTYRGKYFKLDPADDTDYIDLAAHLWRPVGITSTTNTAFQGHFDGGGCTIRNIRGIVNYTSAGFFGYLSGRDSPVTIQNLNLSGEAIQGMTGYDSYTGALAATAFGTITLKNCAVDGMAITGGSGNSRTGGLIGYASNVNLTMQSCAVRTNIQGGGELNSLTGGLVGDLNGSLTLTDSYFQGIVIGGESATIYNSTGGLVGRISGNSTFEATNSYVSGQVIGGTSGDLATGGLVGYGDAYSSLSFTHCLAVLEKISGPDGSAVRRIVVGKAEGISITYDNTYAYAKEGNWNQTAPNNGENWDGNLSGEPIAKWDTDDIWVEDPENENLPTLKGLFFQGKGTIKEPYLITNARELDWVRKAPNKHFLMTQDINLSKRLGTSKAPGEIYGAEGWLPIGNWDAAFTGTFDGGGFTISGLWINRGETYRVGFFGYIGDESIIKNLTVEIPEGEVVTGRDYVGGLLGLGNTNTTLQNCRVTGGGKVTGTNNIGGLVGYMYGSILRSAATVEVSGSDQIAGLVGTLHNGSATQSYATGQVTVSGDPGDGGGLVGKLNSGSLFQCYALGDIERAGKNQQIGGLVGNQHGNITQCYAAGKVGTDDGDRGGLSGNRSASCTLNTSFYNTTNHAEGFPGVGFGDSNGVTGITSEEMQKRGTFLAAGWTFNQENWSIREGEAFPHFSWEEWDGYPPATTLHSVWLEVGAGITANHQAGELLITEEDHLFLNFWADEAGITSDDILLWIDGVETAFTPTIGNRGGSYILNPPTAAQAIVIALRQYTVTLPALPEGFTLTPGAGNHRVDYGKPFQFTVTANDPEALNGLKICINGVELQPDANGQYTIDSVTGPITITIEGFDTTANARLAEGEVTLSVFNNQLYMVNTTDRPVPVAVYNLTGKNIVSLPALRGSQTITLPAGIYLVRTGQTSTKLLIP